MTRHFLLVTFFLSIGCYPSHSNHFTEVECSKEEMPKYDGNKVTMLNDAGTAIGDTIIDFIEKRRTIFKPCRDYIFRAEYFDKNRNVITNSRIKMTANGKRWEFQPDKQDEIIIQYEFTPQDQVNASKHRINKLLQDSIWFPKTTTGIIENVDEIWMHPFRQNQFSFTEVAPFPQIEFPLELNKTWTGNLSIQGWGDWDNTDGYMEYQIVSKERLVIKYGKIEDCWKIVSQATYPFGKSKLDYWFNEKLGFVKFAYVNYGGQYLNIELEEIKG